MGQPAQRLGSGAGAGVAGTELLKVLAEASKGAQKS